MSDALISCGILYVVVMLGIACIAARLYDEAPCYDRRDEARILILLPVWPVLAIYWTVKGIRKLWTDAEWGAK